MRLYCSAATVACGMVAGALSAQFCGRDLAAAMRARKSVGSDVALVVELKSGRGRLACAT